MARRLTSLMLSLCAGQGSKPMALGEVYWLEAVVLGAMEVSVQHAAANDNGCIKCRLCGESLDGPVWLHLVYTCTAMCTDFEDEGIAATGHLAFGRQTI